MRSVLPARDKKSVTAMNEVAGSQNRHCEEGRRPEEAIHAMYGLLRALCFLAVTAVSCIFINSPAHAQCTGPAGVEGEVIMNQDQGVYQYCDNTNWIAMAGAEQEMTGPEGCPTIGDVCIDGSVYAGLSPDGNVPMYTTPADYGALPWNNGNGSGYVNLYTPVTESSTGGEASTAAFIGVDSDSGTGGVQPFQAPEACYNLNAHGYSDWYVPSENEFNVLYTNNAAIGGFSYTFYWTATEVCCDAMIYASISDGGTGSGVKHFNNALRCVRKQGDGEGRLSQQTQIVPNGLVAHWRLDETSGTVAADSSGNGHGGSYTNVAPATDAGDGVINNALNFKDDSSARIEAASSTDFGNLTSFTMSAWIKPEVFNNYMGVIDIPTVGAIWLDFDSDRVDFAADGQWRVDSSGAVAPDTWSHVAVTYDYSDPLGTDPLIYINGVAQSIGETSSSSGYTPPGGGDIARIGNIDLSGVTRNFHGLIDDVRIYNRELSAAEIQEIYNARDGIKYNEATNVPQFFDGNKHVPMVKFPDVTGGLVGHWKLDETSGTTAADSAGSNDATVNGSDFNALSIPGAVGKGLTLKSYSLTMAGGAAYSPAIGQSATYSVWFRTESTLGGDIFLLDEWLGNERASLRIASSKTDLWMGFRDTNLTSETGTFASGENLNDGQWRHAVFVVDRSSDQARAFMNGVEIGVPVDISTLTGAGIGFNDSTITVEPTSGHLADVDDIRIYDRALSATEIQTLYNMGAPTGINTALPQGCPSIGDACDDGTIYAGTSPDGSVAMFTTPADAPSTYTWNDGTTNYTDMSMVNCTDASPGTAASCQTGEANTAFLVGATGEPDYPFAAAAYCDGLSAHGYDDWYLPAQDELNVLYTNKNTGDLNGTFDESGSEYWSSSEYDNGHARLQRFNDGIQSIATKNNGFPVRCVRKGAAPRCANPYGVEGQMIYNGDANVMQYCDGARWLAIGKKN